MNSTTTDLIPKAPLMSRALSIVFAWGSSLFLITSLTAQEIDEPLPEVIAASHFSALKSSSPFTRSLSVSDSLVLTGVANIDGKPVATLLDTKTSQSYILSDEPNENGWKMVSISPGTELDQLVASISIDGGEVVRVRYDREGISRSMKTRPSATGGPRVPRGPDNRPAPTDEERRKFGEYVKAKMSKMTEEQKKQVGKMFGEKMKANPKMSDHQKGALFKDVLEHVAAGKK